MHEWHADARANVVPDSLTNRSKHMSYIPTDKDVSESKFLRKEDIEDGGLIVTIKEFDKQNVAMDNEEPQHRVIVKFMEQGIKGFVCNSTNWQLLKLGLGSDAAQWIGHRIKLVVDPTVSFGGKIVGGIRVRTSRAAPPEPPQRPVHVDPFDDDVPFN